MTMIKTVTGKKLLIVEDDDKLRNDTRLYFSKRENTVVAAATVAEARQALQNERFDAIVLDLILPDGEGLELFDIDDLPPVIIMTSLSGEYDMLEGFSSGACDYVVKPCSPEILEARLSLRIMPSAGVSLTADGLTLDTVKRQVFYGGEQLVLTGTEFNILKFLMENRGKFFTADKLYECVWQESSFRSNSIKYHISNLRQKLLAATGKNLIATGYGKGYSFISGGSDE